MQKRTAAQLAKSWLVALSWVVAIFALIVFIGSGNLFGDYYDFNTGVAFVSTIGFVALSLPMLGAFHVTARHLEAQEGSSEEMAPVRGDSVPA